MQWLPCSHQCRGPPYGRRLAQCAVNAVVHPWQEPGHPQPHCAHSPQSRRPLLGLVAPAKVPPMASHQCTMADCSSSVSWRESGWTESQLPTTDSNTTPLPSLYSGLSATLNFCETERKENMQMLWVPLHQTDFTFLV